jgi:hypothetical protein
MFADERICTDFFAEASGYPQQFLPSFSGYTAVVNHQSSIINHHSYPCQLISGTRMFADERICTDFF